MSFVPQPYEQFVNDLLTALTGGIVREEHRFIGTDQSYSLSSPGVIASSIRVLGQRNQSFALFERGIDFIYDDKQQSIRWKPDANLPDDHSYFYINYYRSEGQRRLSDRNPGSVTTTLAEAFAREFAVLHRQLEAIYQSAFLNLAAGVSLDHVTALLGLSRKDAKFAGGEVLFKRGSPAPGDIVIASGTVVSTDQGQNFETTDKRTLRRGQLSVTAPVRAQVEGPSGKVDAAAIRNINRPIFGIESVSNEGGTFFATRKETDEELRRRALGSLERAGKATVDAIRYTLLEDLPEITDANIQVAEKAETPGFVEVRLGLDAPAQPELVRRVEESIFNSRPAGVRVTHNLPTRARSESEQHADAITREQALSDLKARGEPPGTQHLPSDVLAAMPESVLRLRVEVLLRLAQANLSTAQKENIEETAREAIAAYIEALPMGATLIFNKLLGLIIQPEEIEDASMVVGAEAGGQFYKFTANLATDGRKATVDPYRIFVGLMEETVFVDIDVQVEANPAKTTQEPVRVSDEVKSAVRDAVNANLITAKDKLLKQDLVETVRTVLAARAPQLQMAAAGAVVLNAEFEESGRLLNNTDELALEPNEKPSLRKFDVRMPGVLDG